MRIHSDILTESDLYDALPSGVHINLMQHGSRKRDHAFEVRLYVMDKDELHRRYCNGGNYGANTYDVAATWDEWGIWMANLYAIDPAAIIGWYESPSHFLQVTEKHRNYVRMAHKPHNVEYKTHTAPWLEV